MIAGSPTNAPRASRPNARPAAAPAARRQVVEQGRLLLVGHGRCFLPASGESSVRIVSAQRSAGKTWAGRRDARQAFQTWELEADEQRNRERQQRAEQRLQAIRDCNHCDEYGWSTEAHGHPIDPAIKCSHRRQKSA
ncbi:hypothetical protein [Mycobacterium sp.]|uniref:hypothetical protein n=1 Tax=Mycobacterium sp. TaxID=1785 RepID=UPI002CB6D958|nr:hypothetical protein [Mycobacterium sp.]HME50532.1 hypothetical protein [Mycobacterium sp.]